MTIFAYDACQINARWLGRVVQGRQGLGIEAVDAGTLLSIKSEACQLCALRDPREWSV
jgi:hypothetical protein